MWKIISDCQCNYKLKASDGVSDYYWKTQEPSTQINDVSQYLFAYIYIYITK